MKPVPEDVIIDLLPLYFAGEASPASCELVEAYLQANPGFAAVMQDSQSRRHIIPANAPENAEHLTMKRLRSDLKLRSALIAIGIFVTLLPFSFVFKDSRLVYMMIRDEPVMASAFLVIAAIVWGALWLLVRRSNSTRT